jgi:hypothetical protein
MRDPLSSVRTFERNHEQAQRSAREQLRIILANTPALRYVKGGGALAKAAREMDSQIRNGRPLTPKQMSFIDSIYEKTMRGAGFEAAPVHVDKKRRGLRFG